MLSRACMAIHQALDESFAAYVKKLSDEFAPATDFNSEGLPKRGSVAELKAIVAESRAATQRSWS